MADNTLPSQKICKGASSAALIGNGAINNFEFIASLVRCYERCIAVDAGLAHCHAMNIIPDLIIGDLDSLSPDILKLYGQVPLEVFPKDKDKSDMELAIQHANTSSIEKIALFGAMEKRTDHALANLQMICRSPGKVVIETELESIFCLKGKQRIETYPGQTISLIPLDSSPTGVTTTGLKWELDNANLDKNFFSLSNVCLGGKVEISIGTGTLICCLSR